jgi:F-type H+-transporting ATPase subunit epsilon
MESLRLTIVTPSGEIFNDDVASLTLPGKEGEFGVLPRHASLVSSLTVGVIIIEKLDKTTEAVAINWGYASVDERSVSLLIDSAVSLSGNETTTGANLQKAKELVNSVQNSNISIATIESKISSFA